jgi:predicted ATPase
VTTQGDPVIVQASLPERADTAVAVPAPPTAEPAPPAPLAEPGPPTGPAGRHTPETAGAGGDGFERLSGALTALRDTLATIRYPLVLPDAADAERSIHTIVGQLDDYLLPRLRRIDAPLLVVVGGSTGAGKSTLINSLVRAPVSLAGVLRPTTRAPVVVCHPDDMAWFTEANLLPGLGRTRTQLAATDALRVVSADALAPGLAFLDAPDIDSVVDANRALAVQLLAAADLWLFVTTAARYADAVPWEMLRTARDRGTAVALVLDRVPAGAADVIGPHLMSMLRAHGLGGAPLFVLPEDHLDGQGLLGERLVAPMRDWFEALASSATARAAIVGQTVDGAIAALGPGVERLAAAADRQIETAELLGAGVTTVYRTARETVEQGIRDGALLRGEVLARWQELVGTGDLMRSLQMRIGRVRDRAVAAVSGRPVPAERLQTALESGLTLLVLNSAAEAAEAAAAAWRTNPAGAALLADNAATLLADGDAVRQIDTDAVRQIDSGVVRRTDSGQEVAPRPPEPIEHDPAERVERLVRDWQRAVLDLVRTEAGGRRTLARASAYAVNGTGLLVMLSVFAATSFIPTGAEIVVAGGTTVAAQKVLEAIFGDQAVRSLAEQARTDLLSRVDTLLVAEAERFRSVLDGVGIDPGAADRLRRTAIKVEAARAAAPLPAAAALPRPLLGAATTDHTEPATPTEPVETAE